MDNDLFPSLKEENEWIRGLWRVVMKSISPLLVDASLDMKSRILELDCRLGEVLAELALRFPTLNLVGAYHDEGIVELARGELAKKVPLQSQPEIVVCNIKRDLNPKNPLLNGPFDVIGGKMLSWWTTKEQEAKLYLDAYDLLKTSGLFWRTEITSIRTNGVYSNLLLNALMAAICSGRSSIQWFDMPGGAYWAFQKVYNNVQVREYYLPFNMTSHVDLERETAIWVLGFLARTLAFLRERKILDEDSLNLFLQRCQDELQIWNSRGVITLKSIWGYKSQQSPNSFPDVISPVSAD